MPHGPLVPGRHSVLLALRDRRPACPHPLIQKVFEHRRQQDAYDDCERKNGCRGPLSWHGKRKFHEIFDTGRPGKVPTISLRKDPVWGEAKLGGAAGQAFGAIAADFGAGNCHFHAEIFFDL